MFGLDKTLWKGSSTFADYEVAEQHYNHRPARLLFSGRHEAVQSGMALDDKPELLFDYNQRFMELCAELQPARVLLIGGGAMTLPTALLQAFPSLMLDVVERDELLITVAEQYFNYVPSTRLNVFHGDGRIFLNSAHDPYDLIIIDAFSHLHIPEALSTLESAQAVRAALNEGGHVAVNIVSPYYGRSATIIRHQLAAYSRVFTQVQTYAADASDSGWLNQNLVLVAGDSDEPPFISAPLPPLDLTHEQPLHDV